MQIKIAEYIDQTGNCPYRAWFDKLPISYAVKVHTAVERVAHGNTSTIKWFAGFGELKIDWGPGLRVYLVQDGDTLIVLFGGGTKASQIRDIQRVKALVAEFKFHKARR